MRARLRFRASAALDSAAQRISHENRRYRHRLRRTGHRHLPRRKRQRCHVRRYRRAKIAQLRRGEVPIYEPGLAELVCAERRKPDGSLHHRPGRRHTRLPADLPRRGHAARPTTARPIFGSLVAVDRPSLRRISRRTRSSSPRARCRWAPTPRLRDRLARADRPRVRRGEQSRVSQGRGGDRRLHEARPRGRRRAAARKWRRAVRPLRAVSADRQAALGACRPRAPR